MSHVTLLTIIARIPPEAWDAIIPHGPVLHDRAVQARFDSASRLHALAFGAAEMTTEVIQAALASEVAGGAPQGFVSEFIADWCGTPWPRRWPWPWPGPRPDLGPQPDPWDLQTARVVGAVVLASAASRLDSELGKIFADGAEQLAEVAIRG